MTDTAVEQGAAAAGLPAEGTLPADPALVPANADAALTPPPADAALAPGGMIGRAMDFLAAGGPVVMVLIACSVVALAIILMKLWQFHRARLGDRRAARAVALLRQGCGDEALALLAGARDPLSLVVARAMHGCRRRDLQQAAVREEVLRSGNELIDGLRSHLNALEVIGGIAPLLGLFGTVLGMIEAFRRLAEAGNQVDPAILSGGIWEALLTTAVGLAVAIPVVVLSNWLERRVDRVAQQMDSLVTQVFTPDLTPQMPQQRMQSHDSASLRLAGAE